MRRSKKVDSRDKIYKLVKKIYYILFGLLIFSSIINLAGSGNILGYQIYSSIGLFLGLILRSTFYIIFLISVLWIGLGIVVYGSYYFGKKSEYKKRLSFQLMKAGIFGMALLVLVYILINFLFNMLHPNLGMVIEKF